MAQEIAEGRVPDGAPGAIERANLFQRHYALIILTLAYTSSHVDRGIVNIVMQPIKNEFHVNDTLLGLMSGLAFALFYATLGVPIAMWADRGNRRNIIALAVTVWSGMTAACGLASNFTHLLMARIGVGVGEAGSSPPSHSMIADLYPKESRSTTMAIYSVGVYAGAMIGLVFGGYVVQHYGWRMTFYVMGLPGLAIAFLVRFTVKEPARGHADGIAHDAQLKSNLLHVIVHLWQTKSARHITIGLTLVSFVGYGGLIFGPSFFQRSLGLSPQQVGLFFGLIAGFVGGLGALIGGYLADRLSKRDMRWNAWVIAVAKIIGMPLFIVFYFSSDLRLMIPVYIASSILGAFYLGPSFAMIQSLTPLHMRALASAVMLFVLNFIALGFGPLTVGLISDLLAPHFGQESLRWALFGTSFIGVWAAVHYYWAGKTYQADIEKLTAN
ncbi:MFS transporter [Parvibaculum sedimenti]|uniref:MFS transporter n=1 Tax=Parvibaculum sedimenti TaxID=2608632 RepID=A0A6N6VJN1_9HYPH|nr:MFS transporter [Parvibaculum sedimenti]KAB7738703.1 MFS transporter [Parvibaculum sedimenti]